MTHFPLFLNLKNKNVLIFGGGDFAYQRINKLKPFGTNLTVIAEEISEDIKRLEDIKFIERAFQTDDLNINPSFVVIAENEHITKKIYTECNKRNIPVNSVDMPQYCDIIFPSIISTDHLCIGISSGGISPTATVEFKEQFEKMIPENIDEILEQMPIVRDYIKNNTPKKYHKILLKEVFKEAITKNQIPNIQDLDDLI